MVSIIIIHHENISIDIIFVTLSCILSTVLSKTDVSIKAALICIYQNFPKIVGVTTQLDFINPYDVKTTKNLILQKIHRFTIISIGASNGLKGPTPQLKSFFHIFITSDITTILCSANNTLHIQNTTCCGNYIFRNIIRKKILLHNFVGWS